jgi:hypothetical protein
MRCAQKITAIILLIFSISVISCTKTKDDYPTKGVLVGFDPRMCPCCGGIFVNLNDIDTVNAATKLCDSLPSAFIYKPEELPLKVQFAWDSAGSCINGRIIITKIKRR